MIILITGTSRGIGKYLAESLLDKGHIVLGMSRSKADINHENYYHYSVDIIQEMEVITALKDIRKKWKVIDILINNAGVASMNHFILTPLETAQKVMNVNFFGTFNMCREVSKLMKKSNNGRIINFTTVAVPLNLAGEAVYASSKAAVETLTKILAKELANYNITVNGVGPVPIPTDLIAGVPKDKLENLIEHQAIKRFGTKEDVLNIVEFYISPKSNFITGQILYLGGIN